MQLMFYLHADINPHFEVFIGKSLISSGVEAYGMVKASSTSGPYMRAGVFWPNVGLRYDDHTYFTRDFLDDGIANYYMQRMENGAVEVGYRSQNLALSVGIINDLSSIFFTPDNQAHYGNAFYIRSIGRYNLLLGASILYKNVSYYMADLYLGAGIRDWLAIISEFQHYRDVDVATLSFRWIVGRGIHLIGVYNASGRLSSLEIGLTRIGGGLSLFFLPNLEYQFRYYIQSDGNDALINSFHLMF